jgi:hypothetical protein
MASTDLKINVIAELERIGYAYEFTSEDELKVVCPFHDDSKPSAGISVSKRLFKCQVCEAKGDILTLLAKILNTTRRVVFEDMLTRYDIDDVKSIDALVVERFHNAIWTAKPLLKELYDRGITNDMIREYRIGYDGGRITIPVQNEAGTFVNIRKYLPGAPGNEKMKNVRGHGQMRMFMPLQLKYDKIVICGGELKAIVTAAMLNEHGIGAISLTGGEGNWGPKHTARLKDKHVWVMLDVDEAGVKASLARCAQLKSCAAWVGDVKLPLDKDKYAKGDINDWVGHEGATAAMLKALLDETVEWQSPALTSYDTHERPLQLHLSKAIDAKRTGKRIKVKGLISAMDTAPYVIPRKVNVACSLDQNECGLCPLFSIKAEPDGQRLIDVSPESPGILEMVSASKLALHDALITALGCPRCDVVKFTPVAYYNAEDVRISPQLEITNRAADRVMQPAICVGHGLELNETYWFIGRMFPHPKTQQSTLLISKYKTAQDALSSYALDEPARLQIFQPAEWTIESLGAKLDQVYSDIESNVTRIFERRDMHLIIDLAYHSTLLFKFDDRVIKGWAEVLILGDSSQGKSETCLQLMRHYGLGEKVECKNASVAGLLGGLQQMGSKWFVAWGVIPTHDKRLVVLEELKGANTEVIAKLTDMRSSGIAEIPKIEKRRTHARTRLIALSNPRSEHPLSSYNYGIEAIPELIGSLEDVRRFDMALLVSADEIDAARLNSLMQTRPVVSHTYTSDLCKKLILWAWTRTPEQAILDPEARNLALSEATRLCGLFSERIPLVDRGSMRLKIARLAVSLACRTFSTTNFESVLVRPCHVQYISNMLERIYSSSTFGYRAYTAAMHATQEITDVKHVRTKILQTPFPRDFVDQLISTNVIELRDICDWCGWPQDAGIDLLSLLVRRHALHRDGRGYRKTPRFIELLKELLQSNELTTACRPEYVEEF